MPQFTVTRTRVVRVVEEAVFVIRDAGDAEDARACADAVDSAGLRFTETERDVQSVEDEVAPRRGA